ncbi:MAG: cupin domain-containing protein [Pseudomonadota bacterium]
MKITHLDKALAAEPMGTFLDVATMNGRNVGACHIQGVSPVWEMHPDTDEFFHILEGEFEITLRLDEGEEHHVIPAGSVFVVPRGIWHKPAAPGGAKFMYFTPGQSLHSDAADPLDA